jgi:hypothetical protein
MHFPAFNRPATETSVWLARRFVGAKMDAEHTPTGQSILYRKRAAKLARRADTSEVLQEQADCLKQAL